MTAASRDLELLVQKIQQQLAPNSEVLHDVRLTGRLSDAPRQIDVLVRDRIGQFEMNIVIDAKDHSRPVDVKGVEEFAGLVADVGAHRGVLVCPKGFTDAAKNRAKGLQIDLYSPVDTDPHKWQAMVTAPAIIDFRGARISFGVSSSAPGPLRLHEDFFTNAMVFDREDKELGTIAKTAIDKWNAGRFPIEPGVHEKQPIFESKVTRIDNGYDGPMRVRLPVSLYAGIWVERQLYYGQVPITKLSGFFDHHTGQVITNAFTVKVIEPEEVVEKWLRIDSIDQAPVRPVLRVRGLWAWPEDLR